MRGVEKCRGEFSLVTMACNFTRALDMPGARKLGDIAPRGGFMARKRPEAWRESLLI